MDRERLRRWRLRSRVLLLVAGGLWALGCGATSTRVGGPELTPVAADQELAERARLRGYIRGADGQWFRPDPCPTCGQGPLPGLVRCPNTVAGGFTIREPQTGEILASGVPCEELARYEKRGSTVRCPRCKGRGWVRCPGCDGRRAILVPVDIRRELGKSARRERVTGSNDVPPTEQPPP